MRKVLYLQLVNDIKKDFCQKLNINDKLPSEREICEIYNVSRTTVREAIALLEKEGYIYRIHGKGTFLSAVNKNKNNLGDYYSFTEQTRSQGKTPKSIVLKFEVIENSFILKELNLKNNEKIIKFLRLRLADDIPMMIETTYLPYNRFSTLTKNMLNEKPMYDIFEKDYNSKIVFAEETFSAGILNDINSKYLKVNEGDACLKLTRISYDIQNNIIEFTTSIARADKFNYKIYYYHNK